ncbi:sugar ABC transporter permease [Alicyclobacillus fastidiosus]|uniref:Maltose/maltodextrin transport system permease protein n=1 Tax=Alicyclobacillus fastidiosus TaxID=392011 RepID=A0ABY6ZH56_9BACL|nr:sugar ABC transporter permease [Alicyclobacillus fastidiosus]WAH42055.1 sugar ABC transporter permease [Alicyclobacillus fastidiosus]
MSAVTSVGRKQSDTRAKRKHKIQWSAYGYISPAILTMCVLSFLPMFFTIYISFTNWSQMHFMNYRFVGWKNYIELFSKNNPLSIAFLPTLVWTLVFTFVSTTLNYFVGLILAILVNDKALKEARIYRTLLIIPWAIPALISTLSWQGLMNQNYGQINALLHLFHIPAIPWLVAPGWARVSIILVNLWLSFPYFMTVSLGALQSIPTEQYESAAIDGTNAFQRFSFITFPNVWRVSLPLLIPAYAATFNNFNIIFLLTGGGPARATTQFAGYTDILASSSYKIALQFNRYDLSATLSVVLFVMIGVISIINMRFTNAFKGED